MWTKNRLIDYLIVYQMIERLKKKIEKVFVDTAHPGNKQIFSMDRKTLNEPLSILSVTTWKDLDSQSIRTCYQTIPFFTPEALHYFLPAFLLYALDHFNAEDEVCMFIIYALTPGKEYEKGRNWWRERFHLFTETEMSVIHDFLHLVCSDVHFKNFAPIIEKGRKRLQEYTRMVQ